MAPERQRRTFRPFLNARQLSRLASLALLAGSPAAAQVVMPSPLQPVPGGVPGLSLALELDPAAYTAVQEADRVQFAAFMLDHHRAVDLHLERFEVLADDARIIIADGQHDAPSQRPDVVLLRGEVAGHPQSGVFLALSPHGNHGYVRLSTDGFEETWIITTPPEAMAAGQAPTIIYNLTRLPDEAIEWLQFTCGVRDAVQNGGARPAAPARARDGDGSDTPLPCRRVRIAIETDWEYAAIFGGNPVAAHAYIVTLLGAVNEIFVRDVNTRLEVVYARVWSTPADPYITINIDDRLIEFRNHWNANMQGVSRHIAHMLSGVRAGSGGIAWVGVLCSTPDSYGISGYINGAFPYPLVNNHSQNWDVQVVAHEIGHNFKAPHTHTMTPPVDNCGNGSCAGAHLGTIMSYCHICPGGVSNIRLDLHARVIDEHIAPYLDTLSCGLLLAPISINQQPLPRTVIEGQNAHFSVSVSGAGPHVFRWMRNNINLTEGGGITGATTANLTISAAELGHAGEYRVRISNPCGQVTSAPAQLTILESCYANCTMSTAQPFLSIDDFTCFINAFSYAQSLPHAQQVLHYANCDRSTTAPALTVDDYQCFIDRFAVGCP